MHEYDTFKHKLHHKHKAGIASSRKINTAWRSHCRENSDSLIPKESKGRPPKKWKTDTNPSDSPLPTLRSTSTDPLFNIGQNTSQLSGTEKIFYEDQCTKRCHLLSEEIDFEYEDEQTRLSEIESQLRHEEERQESFSNPPEFQEDHLRIGNMYFRLELERW